MAFQNWNVIAPSRAGNLNLICRAQAGPRARANTEHRAGSCENAICRARPQGGFLNAAWQILGSGIFALTRVLPSNNTNATLTTTTTTTTTTAKAIPKHKLWLLLQTATFAYAEQREGTAAVQILSRRKIRGGNNITSAGCNGAERLSAAHQYPRDGSSL